MPKGLLGSGDLANLNKNYPLYEYSIEFRLYYLGTMGYHVHQMIYHAFEQKRNDFVEMFLHHVVTLVLYGFSYLTNMTDSGAAIMYLHDWADIFASIIRCFTETTIHPITFFGAFGMVVSWFYTRIYMFPYLIYYSCFNRNIYGDDK